MTQRIRMTLSEGHQVNFGTAEEPDNKVNDQVVECDKQIAEQLIEAGLATKLSKTKEEDQHGE